MLVTTNKFMLGWLMASSILITGCGSDSDPKPDDETPVAGLIEPGPNEAILYYRRDDASYQDWGLHLWNTESCSGVASPTEWADPLTHAGVSDDYGAYYRIDLSEGAECLNLIMHRGDEKDLGGNDLVWRFSELGRRVFTLSGVAQLSPEPMDAAALTLEGASAHWLDASTLVWSKGASASTVELRYDSSAGITLDPDTRAVNGGQSLSLTPATLSDELKARFPHLAELPAFTVAADAQQRRDALDSQLIAIARDADNQVSAATRVQTPGVLDDLYAYDGKLGAEVTGSGVDFAVWAPTAQQVRLHAFNSSKQLLPGYPVLMEETDGVWRHSGDLSLDRAYYQYEVTAFHPSTDKVETMLVTDPYALSLSRNSQYSQVVNLADSDLKPAGWDSLTPPAVSKPEDIVVYEAHIRDFSATDGTVEAAARGKYAAFSAAGSAGTQHLQRLAAAGLTHLQLLPAFDIATVNEDPAERVDIDDDFSRLCQLSEQAAEQWSQFCNAGSIRSVLESMDPTTGDAQSLYNTLRGLDSFNWGYDPYHFSAPEGSYASDAEGVTRILEFRQMVQSLTNMGLNVVMDVVYNHTNASGLAEKSVLDKVVPGYYHRRNAETGAIEQSTCCENTASEHRMMEKLMIDSLVTWAEHYRISGFRFDLMGHHMVENMLKAREAVRTVDSNTYFYGEGWNFGEVQDGERGHNAVQHNMAGTGIGTFNDRARDAVRGGGPFDGGEALRKNQGFGNGLYSMPNELNSGGSDERASLLAAADLIRVGITGGLAGFIFETADGTLKAGQQVDYNGQNAGYTEDPQELINYVSKHDNQTLWDNNQYKFASSLSSQQRARMQVVGLAVPMLSQGIPFIHMGSELLRSKSMQRDSYDSGDWFNEVDFSYQTSAWNRGLPREDKDGDNWPLIQQIIADSNARPTSSDIAYTLDRFEELLSIRAGTPLLRLGTAAEVNQRLRFYNTGTDQTPGLIAYSLDDGTQAGADLDPAVDALMVIINATPDTQTLATGFSGFTLHPLHASSSDATLTSASFSGGTFSVPGMTVAVFEQPQGEAQGPGVPKTDSSGGSFETAAPGEALVYYYREDGNYDGWGLHLWNTGCTGVVNETDWAEPLAAAGVDDQYGAYYRVPLLDNADCFNLIVHKGDEKDPDADLSADLTADSDNTFFITSGIATVSSEPMN